MALNERREIIQPITKSNNLPNVNFQVNKFDDAVKGKGSWVWHEKAIRCACINKDTGAALPNCMNCAGIGWFYIEKRKTKALVQGINFSSKQMQWTEADIGRARVTMISADEPAFADRITALDRLSNFSQTLYVVENESALFSFLIYEPVKVFSVYLFVGSASQHKLLKSKQEQPNDWDYEIFRNRLQLNADRYSVADDIQLSIRYKHHPIFQVTEIPRETFVTESSDITQCGEHDEGMLKEMPVLLACTKLHYLPEAMNFSGIKTFDNTDYSKFKM